MRLHDAVAELLKLGANANGSIAGECTPLMVCGTSQVYEVEMLIKYGANINAQNNEGNTALHFSLSKLNILKKLIEAGANSNIENKYGMTGLEMAFSEQISEGYQFLFDKTIHRQNTLEQAIHTMDYKLISLLVKENIPISANMIINCCNNFGKKKSIINKILKKLIVAKEDISDVNLSKIKYPERVNWVQEIYQEFNAKKEHKDLNKLIKSPLFKEIKKMKI
jgi:ankyrin repeat protein